MCARKSLPVKEFASRVRGKFLLVVHVFSHLVRHLTGGLLENTCSETARSRSICAERNAPPSLDTILAHLESRVANVDIGEPSFRVHVRA